MASKLLTIAIQMDAIEAVNIDGDTTFALALEAQQRGHTLLYYQPQQLSLHEGIVVANVQPITLKCQHGDHFQLGEPFVQQLADTDVVLMRQDPPFDMHYLTYTYLLDKVASHTWVINDPTQVRQCPEKIFCTQFAQFMPPTLISADENTVITFFNEHQDIILKPLYAHGGADIHRVTDKKTLSDTFQQLWQHYHTPIIAQTFLPNVHKGDKRIIFIDGEVVGALNRIPQEGNILSNLVQGGTAHKTVLTERELDICQALKAPLKEKGLFLTGIDVIDGYLTEINVTSPTGIQSINALDNVCVEAIFWDKVEEKLKIS